MNTFDLPMPHPAANLSPAARRAERKRAAAERARLYREKIKQEGLPTAREVDQAVAEAIAFIARYPMRIDGRMKLDIGDIVMVAALILKRGGKKWNGSLEAVRDRLQIRDEHTQQHWVPSIRPKQPAMLLPPEGGGRWSATQIQHLHDAIGRHAPKRTPSQP